MGNGSNYDCREYRDVYDYVRKVMISAMLPNKRMQRRPRSEFLMRPWVLGSAPADAKRLVARNGLQHCRLPNSRV